MTLNPGGPLRAAVPCCSCGRPFRRVVPFERETVTITRNHAQTVRLTPADHARLPAGVRIFIDQRLRRDCWIDPAEVYRIDLGDRWWIIHRYRQHGKQCRINWVGRAHRKMVWWRHWKLRRLSRRGAQFGIRYRPWPGERAARRVPLAVRLPHGSRPVG